MSYSNTKTELGPFLLEEEIQSLRNTELALIVLLSTNFVAAINTKYDLERGLTPAEIESQAFAAATTPVIGTARYIFGDFSRKTICKYYNSQN